jgi:hypothetical protein
MQCANLRHLAVQTKVDPPAYSPALGQDTRLRVGSTYQTTQIQSSTSPYYGAIRRPATADKPVVAPVAPGANGGIVNGSISKPSGSKSTTKVYNTQNR